MNFEKLFLISTLLFLRLIFCYCSLLLLLSTIFFIVSMSKLHYPDISFPAQPSFSDSQLLFRSRSFSSFHSFIFLTCLSLFFHSQAITLFSLLQPQLSHISFLFICFIVEFVYYFSPFLSSFRPFSSCFPLLLFRVWLYN